MLKKQIFTELFYIQEKLNKLSLIDTQLIKNHLLSNCIISNKYKDNQYWYMSQYFKVEYHQHIKWFQEYLTDHYLSEHKRTLVFNSVDSIRCLLQKNKENIILHNNLKEWDLPISPDIDCIFTISTGKKPSYIVFEYDDGRHKHRRYKLPLLKDHFILFPSHLNRYITSNENEETLINLSLHFQLE